MYQGMFVYLFLSDTTIMFQIKTILQCAIQPGSRQQFQQLQNLKKQHIMKDNLSTKYIREGQNTIENSKQKIHSDANKNKSQKNKRVRSSEKKKKKEVFFWIFKYFQYIQQVSCTRPIHTKIKNPKHAKKEKCKMGSVFQCSTNPAKIKIQQQEISNQKYKKKTNFQIQKGNEEITTQYSNQILSIYQASKKEEQIQSIKLF
eukprot:TRINITY_DN782_c0_g1_i3.p1 TRINITY_DN782_c0_g1~~TRINITY_DN782_c0_g1_i3.p1  ORF type:complete len:202 (-),score=-1.14 TRINITY_DN782_c0_g1_i3:404-1009(-)